MNYTIDRDYLINTLADIVRIDSINPNLVSGAAGEKELAIYLADAMREIGLELDFYDVQPNRPNVVGILRGRGEGRSLMLNAHTDTVGVEGMQAPFSAEICDGKMYGRGAYDMKASIAATLAVAKAFVEANISLAGDLVLAMVIDEEYGSLGTGAIVKSHPTDAAIVTEPTGLRVCVAHRGWYFVDVETIGCAAHGSRPQDGIDANRLMAYLLTEIDKYDRNLQSREPHPLLGTASIHVPLLNGGSTSFVYAAQCKAQLERRVIPGETVEQVTAEIQTIVDNLSKTVPNFKATVKAGFGRNAFETPQDAEIVTMLIETVTTVLGKKPELHGELWWMDSGLLGDAGIETVIIGPKGAGAHADVEWVDLESVVDLAQILAQMSINYIGK
jgi:acetylornithine deacetylase